MLILKVVRLIIRHDFLLLFMFLKNYNVQFFNLNFIMTNDFINFILILKFFFKVLIHWLSKYKELMKVYVLPLPLQKYFLSYLY